MDVFAVIFLAVVFVVFVVFTVVLVFVVVFVVVVVVVVIASVRSAFWHPPRVESPKQPLFLLCEAMLLFIEPA